MIRGMGDVGGGGAVSCLLKTSDSVKRSLVSMPVSDEYRAYAVSVRVIL